MKRSSPKPATVLLSLLAICCFYTGCKKVLYPDDGSHSLWVVGTPLQGYGSLFHTIDDGFLWERQGIPSLMPGISLTGICASSPTDVWMVGSSVDEYGFILFSSDGGYSLTRVGDKTLFGNITFLVVHAKQTKRVWVGGSNSTLFSTSDQGVTWNKMLFDTLPPVNFTGITSQGNDSIWVIGNHASISDSLTPLLLASFDGGTTWQSQPVDTLIGHRLVSIISINDTTLWLATESTLLCSTNRGYSWVSKLAVTAGTITGLSAQNIKNIWAVSSQGAILSSINGGVTWVESRPFNNQIPLTSIITKGSNLIWVIGGDTLPGSRGVIYYSRNVGQTWFIQEFPGSPPLHAITCIEVKE